MQSTRFLPLLLGALALGALACGEDVGSCDDPVEARDTVLVNSSVQYAGQAIMNQSCANGGCHASGASGESRSGAPKHLNFDLRPAKSSGEDENEVGETIAKIDDDDLAGLRRRQQRVVDERDIIWEQVKKNLMPPDGAFAGLRALTRMFDTDEEDVCLATSDDSFSPITSGASKEVLRNWLACGAPIVESNTEIVSERTAGTVGYQYPQCAAKAEGNTLEAVQATIFDEYCTSCHPGSNDLDLSDADMSFASLVEDKSIQCNDKPYVTPGNPARSFLIDLLTKEDPGCKKEPMPYGADPLTAEEVKVVSDWIRAGAKREGE